MVNPGDRSWTVDKKERYSRVTTYLIPSSLDFIARSVAPGSLSVSRNAGIKVVGRGPGRRCVGFGSAT